MRNRVLFVLFLVLAAGLVFAGGKQEQPASASDQTSQQATDQSADATPVDESSSTPISTADPTNAAATVNGVPILKSDLDTALDQTVQRYQSQGQAIPSAQMATLRTQILDQLINEELLYQEAIKQGLSASATAVESQYQQIRGNYDTDAAWQQALTDNATTEAELRTQLERNAVIQDLIASAVGEPAAVTDQDVQDFYDANPQYFQQGEQIAARHILISTDGLTTDEQIAEAKARAEAIRQQLVDGADFAELAKEKSEGPSASRGGDLGTFGRGSMVKPFEDAAFALDVGQISDVVQTQFGFHIIQVTQKIPAQVTPIADVTDSIKNYISQQRKSDALQAYIDKLRSDADVVINETPDTSSN